MSEFDVLAHLTDWPPPSSTTSAPHEEEGLISTALLGGASPPASRLSNASATPPSPTARASKRTCLMSISELHLEIRTFCGLPADLGSPITVGEAQVGAPLFAFPRPAPSHALRCGQTNTHGLVRVVVLVLPGRPRCDPQLLARTTHTHTYMHP